MVEKGKITEEMLSRWWKYTNRQVRGFFVSSWHPQMVYFIQICMCWQQCDVMNMSCFALGLAISQTLWLRFVHWRRGDIYTQLIFTDRHSGDYFWENVNEKIKCENCFKHEHWLRWERGMRTYAFEDCVCKTVSVWLLQSRPVIRSSSVALKWGQCCPCVSNTCITQSQTQYKTLWKVHFSEKLRYSQVR